ncbi:MAG: hypothetical protein COV10_04895 [Candidatus Vogelbacteria bacterium CG10_big_fil_rev_8_21_14_0_10_51_16]|uniref:Bro-N domain-containing protein n=1 Tax=Candidatus Vogelbacteria bacterium CG10_big_fil_rev_8_21_14_0_10_51_16 TaxID=1975045 RepID=A0A2H0RD93_9BACT|nr:MAG: hypothetical protein COV10_04895 [Candidatus Vogelbacteria bacterium CG10_big_fil_rev_8_21_14_0_10_51_16]
MSGKKLVALFEDKPVRRSWNETEEQWYFSVVDIIAVLTGSENPQVYWRVFKKRLIDEGSGETVTKCNGLKMLAPDGKMRVTDVANVEILLRIIQSVPSPKAEPVKQWLAKVGYERLRETTDPELSIKRGRTTWQKMGRSKKWIEQRMLGVETRNKLTDYWADHGISKKEEYAILTNIIHEEWSGLSVRDHKSPKGLKRQNLRDHMGEAELIFTALAELSTRHISESEKAEGLPSNEMAAHKGGKISGKARRALEQQTGKKVVTGENYFKSKKEDKKLK